MARIPGVLLIASLLGAPALAGEGPYIQVTVSACESAGVPVVPGTVRARFVFDTSAPPVSTLPPGLAFAAIDAGANFALPSGLVFDFGLLDRFVDDPSTPDTGVGDVLPVIDIVAHEFQPGAGPCNDADLAEPFGSLDFSDVVTYLGMFAGGCP